MLKMSEKPLLLQSNICALCVYDVQPLPPDIFSYPFDELDGYGMFGLIDGSLLQMHSERCRSFKADVVADQNTAGGDIRFFLYDDGKIIGKSYYTDNKFPKEDITGSFEETDESLKFRFECRSADQHYYCAFAVSKNHTSSSIAPTVDEIKQAIAKAKEEISTLGVNDAGKKHKYMSQAFVAQLGRTIRSKYREQEYETKFKDFKNGKGVSGEWMLDIAVVQKQQLSKINSHAGCYSKMALALESEFDPGNAAFVQDFSKLLVLKSPIKVYINGVKRSINKRTYITERLNQIKDILQNCNEDGASYYVCFVDHPEKWNNSKDPDVEVHQLA